MGTVLDDDGSGTHDAVLLPLDYDTDSEHRMTIFEGWKEHLVLVDDVTGRRVKRLTKESSGVQERAYIKDKGGTHYVRMFALSADDKLLSKVLQKMQPIHKRYGHLHKQKMRKLCNFYSEATLGYSKLEATLRSRHGRCDGCDAGFTTAVHSGRSLVYVESKNYHDKEGTHTDVFFLGSDRAFLVAKSRKHKVLWVHDVGPGYTAVPTRECTAEVLGDYKYASVETSFVRSDGDTRLQPVAPWLQSLGLRYYTSPPGTHSSLAERITRVLKEVCRAVLHSLEFLMPDKYYPYLVREAVRVVSTRYDEDLQVSPYESFFSEALNYEKNFQLHFGETTSYSPVKTTNSVKQSRVNCGVVLGVEVASGSVVVESPVNKSEERVVSFKSRTPVDSSTRLYYKNYLVLDGTRYSKDHTTYLSLQSLHVPLEDRVPVQSSSSPEETIVSSSELADKLDIVCSAALYRCYRGDSSVSNRRLATGSDHRTPSVDKGSSRQVHFDVLEASVSSNTSAAHATDAHSEPDTGSLVPEILDSVRPSVISEFLDSILVSSSSAQGDLATLENTVLSTLRLAGHKTEDSDIEDTGSTSSIDTQELGTHSSNPSTSTLTGVTQVSYDKVAKVHPSETLTQGVGEYKTLSDRGTTIGVHKHTTPSGAHLHYTLTSLVEKYKAGELERVKSRSPFGGDGLKDQFSLRWDDTSARTVSSGSLNTTLALVAYFGMKTGVVDFKSAFLGALLPEKDQCYAKISRADSKLLTAADPDKWTPFLSPSDQCIYVKVVGALYGHPLSAQLWYDYLKDKLAPTGLTPLPADKCTFTRRHSDATFDTMGLWVDDLTMGSLRADFFDEVRNFLSVHFRGEGSMDVGPKLEYLNLTLSFDDTDRSVTTSQAHYWKKVCTKFGLLEEGTSKCPHKSHFMERLRQRGQSDDTTATSGDSQQKSLLSLVMSMLWGALRSFPDILFNLTALATRSKFGWEVDYSDALQALKYTNSCRENCVRLKTSGNTRLAVFVDSSCNIHADLRGHGGYVTSTGDECYGGPVEASSSRARLSGRSSMDYELYSLHHMLPALLFLHELLEEIGFPQQPATVFEDSRATVDPTRRGKVSTGVTRHTAAKYYFARDLIIRKIIILKHCPTLLMIADILTKDLGSSHFSQLSSRLRSLPTQDPTLHDDIYRKLYADSLYSDSLDHEEQQAVQLLSSIIEQIIQS